MKTISFFLFVLGWSLVISCAPQQHIITPNSLEAAPSEILFLNYEIIKVMYDQKDIRLINQITSKGTLKSVPKKVSHVSDGDLEYTLLDKDRQKIASYIIKNPLQKTIEYVNDFGHFEKKIIDLNSAQFSIRIQRPIHAKYIAITELTTPKSIHTLITELD